MPRRQILFDPWIGAIVFNTQCIDSGLHRRGIDGAVAAGLTLGIAAVLVASGIVAGGVPPSRGALEGVADALRRSAELLGP